jgi:hypothetical protein
MAQMPLLWVEKAGAHAVRKRPVLHFKGSGTAILC